MPDDEFQKYLDDIGWTENTEEDDTNDDFNDVFGSPNESTTSNDSIHPTDEERTEAEKDFNELFEDAL